VRRAARRAARHAARGAAAVSVRARLRACARACTRPPSRSISPTLTPSLFRGAPPRPQILVETLNFAWFAGSTAALLTLPILVELNREHTVRVAQEQREALLDQVRAQTQQQSTFGQMSSVLGNLGIGGLGGRAGSGAEADGGERSGSSGSSSGGR